MRLTPTFSLFCVIGVGLLAGCAPSIVHMTDEDRVLLMAKPKVVAVHYEQPPFMAVTPGRAMVGGLVGVALFVHQGTEMIDEYRLEDPVLRVKELFVSAVSDASGIRDVHFEMAPLEEDVLDGTEPKQDGGLVFDFQTIGWGVSYFPFDFSHYRVGYSARARLIQPEEARVAWQGVCVIEEEKTRRSPSWSLLTANNGELLKRKLDGSAFLCAQQLLEQFHETPA